jgi:galactose-1-phosphate uridylyltransferase
MEGIKFIAKLSSKNKIEVKHKADNDFHSYSLYNDNELLIMKNLQQREETFITPILRIILHLNKFLNK